MLDTSHSTRSGLPRDRPRPVGSGSSSSAGGDESRRVTRRPAVTNITQTVEVSSGLLGWIAGSQYTGTNAVSNTAATTELQRTATPVESVTVRDNVPLDTASRRFMRVRVTSP